MGLPYAAPAAPNYNSSAELIQNGMNQTGSLLNQRYEHDQAQKEEQTRFERDQKLHPDVQFGIQGLLQRMQAGQMSPQEAAAHAKLLVSGQHPSPQDHLPPDSTLLQAPPSGAGPSALPQMPQAPQMPQGPSADAQAFAPQVPQQVAPQVAAAPGRGPLPGYTANDLKAVQGMASADYMSQRPELYREKNAVTEKVAEGHATTEATKETGRNTRADERTNEKAAEFTKMMEFRWASLAASRERTSKLLSLAQQRSAGPEVAALKAILGEQDTLLKQKTSVNNAIQNFGMAAPESVKMQQELDVKIKATEERVEQARQRLMNFAGMQAQNTPEAPSVRVQESQSSQSRGGPIKVRSRKTGTVVVLPPDQAGRFLSNPNYERVP